MFGRETINERRLAGTVNLITSILIVVVAVLFVMSLAKPAIAEGNRVTLKGEVVAVDNYAKTIIVKPTKTTPSSAIGMEGEFTFTLDEKANVTMCTMNKSFRDIGVGEKVEVTYHEKNGGFVVDAIDIATPVYACYSDYE